MAVSLLLQRPGEENNGKLGLMTKGKSWLKCCSNFFYSGEWKQNKIFSEWIPYVPCACQNVDDCETMDLMEVLKIVLRFIIPYNVTEPVISTMITFRQIGHWKIFFPIPNSLDDLEVVLHVKKPERPRCASFLPLTEASNRKKFSEESFSRPPKTTLHTENLPQRIFLSEGSWKFKAVRKCFDVLEIKGGSFANTENCVSQCTMNY